MKVRIYPDLLEQGWQKGIPIENFTLLNIQSITAVNKIQNLFSWRVSVMMDSPKRDECYHCNNFVFNSEFGKAYSITSWMVPHIFAGVNLRGASWLSQYHSLGPSGRVGVKLDFGYNVSLLSNVIFVYPLTGDSHYEAAMVSEGRVSVSRNWEVRAGQDYNRNYHDFYVTGNFYF